MSRKNTANKTRKHSDEDLLFIAKVICDEYCTTQAEKVAKIFKGGGLHSITFSKMTSGDHPLVIVESSIQTAVMNAMRDIEYGLEMRRALPAWISKRKKSKS